MNQLRKMKHFKERLECWLFQDKFSEIIYGIGIIIFPRKTHTLISARPTACRSIY